MKLEILLFRKVTSRFRGSLVDFSDPQNKDITVRFLMTGHVTLVVCRLHSKGGLLVASAP